MSSLIASSQQSLIIGLGVTGVSVARYFARTGKPFSVADSRDNPLGLAKFKSEFPNVHVATGPLTFEQWGNFDQIVLSPGVARTTPAIACAIQAGVEVVGDIELFARAANAPIVAITGSNGKTTVTTLVGEMARNAGIRVGVGGNLGTAALDLLNEDTELYVLELSSFQLESTLQLNAKVATILNVSADHMDRYEGLHDYMRAKQKIYFGASTIVSNRDDALTQPPIATDRQYRSFGVNAPDLKQWGLRKEGNELFIAKGLQNLLNVSSMPVRGLHNALNAQVALALGEAVGIPMPAMLETLQSFKGLAHRCQFIATIDHADFYNDSKGTNVGATVAAVTGLAAAKNIILIAGGDGKGAVFDELGAIAKTHIKALITIGVDGDKVALACKTYCAVHAADSLKDAVQLSRSLIAAGDVVLLSPACASFDMFKSYEDRGEQFIQHVEALCV